MQLKRITNGGRRKTMYVIFRKKNSLFSAIWITFYTFSDPFEKTKLLKFGSHSKELNLPPYLQHKFKTCLNAYILG